MKQDLVFLKHAEEAARKILTFAPESLAALHADEKTQFAIVRLYTVLGEAIKKLSPSLREQYPAIPWKGFTGFRDVLIHQYFNIDLKILWDVTSQQLPTFHTELEKLITSLEK